MGWLERLAIWMQPNAMIHEDAIFEDVSNCVRQALQDVHDQNQDKHGIFAEASAKQLPNFEPNFMKPKQILFALFLIFFSGFTQGYATPSDTTDHTAIEESHGSCCR